MVLKYKDFLLEFVEFINTDEVLTLQGFYDEFRDYVQPFLQKGEWYRIICENPKEKKEAYLEEKGGKRKIKYRPFPKMKMWVMRFYDTHIEFGPWEYILYDKIYINGQIEDNLPNHDYISFDRLKDYKNVSIEHIMTPERMKYLEEWKEKMKDVDPYGEEKWLEESFDFSPTEYRQRDVELIVKVQSKDGCERLMEFLTKMGYRDFGINFKRLTAYGNDHFYLFLSKEDKNIQWCSILPDFCKNLDVITVDELFNNIDKYFGKILIKITEDDPYGEEEWEE